MSHDPSVVYEYKPRPGESINVHMGMTSGPYLGCQQGEGTFGPAVEIRRQEAMRVGLNILLALCKATGVPAPIILERPPETAIDSGVNVFTVSNYNGTVYLGKGSIEGPDALAPDVARLLAATLAEHAGKAESAAEAEVTKLAELLHEIREGIKGGHGEYDMRNARAILDAGYKPPDGDS